MADYSFNINFDGETFEATRYNTYLYTFIGQQMIDGAMEDIKRYDHIYLRMAEDDGHTYGGYIFCSNNAYEGMKNFIEKYRFPQALNSTKVPDCDIAAWMTAHVGEIDSEIEEFYKEL